MSCSILALPPRFSSPCPRNVVLGHHLLELLTSFSSSTSPLHWNTFYSSWNIHPMEETYRNHIGRHSDFDGSSKPPQILNVPALFLLCVTSPFWLPDNDVWLLFLPRHDLWICSGCFGSRNIGWKSPISPHRPPSASYAPKCSSIHDWSHFIGFIIDNYLFQLASIGRSAFLRLTPYEKPILAISTCPHWYLSSVVRMPWPSFVKCCIVLSFPLLPRALACIFGQKMLQKVRPKSFVA